MVLILSELSAHIESRTSEKTVTRSQSRWEKEILDSGTFQVRLVMRTNFNVWNGTDRVARYVHFVYYISSTT